MHLLGGIEAPSKFVKKMLKTKINAMLLLGSFVKKTTSTTIGDSISRISWEITLKELKRFTRRKKQIRQALKLFNKNKKRRE